MSARTADASAPPPVEPARAEPSADAARRLILALGAVGLLVRIAFLLLEPATAPVADERTWIAWGTQALASPRVGFSPLRTRMIFYPPLYPYFIAALHTVFGTLAAVKVAQALGGALLVPAVGFAGRRACGPAAGVAAAAVTAFYPELVWFPAHFWSETLFMALLWWALERLLAADEPRAKGSATGTAALAGLLWGLAILTRETALYFTPLAAAWLAARRPEPGRPRRDRFARGGAFLLAALLVVAPWTWRNWVVFHAFVPVSTSGGLNLYQGNAPLGRQEVYDRYDAIQGRIEQYRWARAQGIAAIVARQPWWIFEKLGSEMPNFWEADSQALVHVRRGAYGSVTPSRARIVSAVVVVPYLLALAAFVAGVAAVCWNRAGLLLLSFLAYYNLIHVATHGYARYRLPALPVVLLFAAWALAAWWQGRYPRLSPRRKALAAVLGLALALSLGPSLKLQLSSPATEPGSLPEEVGAGGAEGP